jgi:hypothetical protein
MDNGFLKSYKKHSKTKIYLIKFHKKKSRTQFESGIFYEI